MGTCSSSTEEKDPNGLNLECLKKLGITASSLYRALEKEEVGEKLELLLIVLGILEEKKLLESATISDFTADISFTWMKSGVAVRVYVSDKTTCVRCVERQKTDLWYTSNSLLEISPNFPTLFQEDIERTFKKYSEYKESS